MDTNDTSPETNNYTTNSHDLSQASQLQYHIAAHNASSQNTTTSTSSSYPPPPPSVSLAPGAHKYVLITGTPPPTSSSNDNNNNNSNSKLPSLFAHSKQYAAYHRNVAEPLIYQLERCGYGDLTICGGGRILRDDDEKKIHVYGYSYGFGMADHKVTTELIKSDEGGLFEGYKVTWSNDGY